MTITHAPEPRSAIEAAGSLPDLELDIATVALQLARVDAPEADWRKVAAHFSAWMARRMAVIWKHVA
ncbi:MAG: hypothetical protein LW713_05330 [Acetobacteraceae bacterium]|nr:hypothetical protein [Acetobacteraceae bacterium]